MPSPKAGNLKQNYESASTPTETIREGLKLAVYTIMTGDLEDAELDAVLDDIINQILSLVP